MAPQVLDSYTGDPYVEDYVSPIADIKRGRESFWRRAEIAKAAEQYWVSPSFPPEEPDAAQPASPSLPPVSHAVDRRPSGWLLRRREAPIDLFPLFPSQAVAVRVMDWCVRNDASIKIAVHWLDRGNPTPFLCMMQDIIKEITNG